MTTARAENKAHRERMEQVYAETARIVAGGICPQCGNTLYRNLALTGWWQCNGFPSPGFRKSGHENDKPCSFQIFTRS